MQYLTAQTCFGIYLVTFLLTPLIYSDIFTTNCNTSFPPLFASIVMSQQLLILEMFIITLVTRLLYRRQYDPLPKEEEDISENTKMIVIPYSVTES